VTASLFDPVRLRDCRIRNRIVMSPMSQHAAGGDGAPTDWHRSHYGERARGGCGLILLEDTAVEPSARTSHAALGLYRPEQVPAFRRVVETCREQGAAVGLQLAHAGRKAFRDTRGEDGGDDRTVSASALAFAAGWSVPRAAGAAALERVRDAFVRATRLASEAGFDTVEVHAAHGYLLHQFLSPLTNRREDSYGGALENRARLLLEVVEAVREQWPAGRPLLVRLPAGDGAHDGSTPAEMATVARWCALRGADLIDVAGGTPLLDGARVGPAEMLAFAGLLGEEEEKKEAVPFALGGVTDGRSAEELLRSSGATLIAVGRQLLADPGWALSAAAELGVELPVSRTGPGRTGPGVELPVARTEPGPRGRSIRSIE
jgi:2,4-dienoyl-CoA reductase-like NADH-dependent reductase (Old Yellow Enzyme family)